MKIYTRFGDKGSTALIGGAVVPKDDLRVEACGAVDELSAVLGLAASMAGPPGLARALESIQADLFVVGAYLATKGKRARTIPPARVDELELEIDRIWAELPPLRHFIIPGGTRTASILHLGRTICRRAERRIITLSRKEQVDPGILTYMNRVGDLLFVLARQANRAERVAEKVWRGR